MKLKKQHPRVMGSWQYQNRFLGRMRLLHQQAKPLPWPYPLARFPVVYPCTDDCGVIMPQGIVTHSGTCPNGINCLLIGEV